MTSPFVVTEHALLLAASADFSGIGDSIKAANAAALTPTTNLLSAAHDEVSTAIA
jgi:hypothetical protein